MKEQDKTLEEKENNETGVSDSPDKEFQIMVIKIYTKLRKIIH